MCEIQKMPKICNYNREKMVNNQNVVVWNKKHKKHRAAIFDMNSEFRYIARNARNNENQKFLYEQ